MSRPPPPWEIAVRYAGLRACFTDPIRKGERASYPVLTPSAAVGILENVYWHPGFKPVVTHIYVEKLGRTYIVATNECEKPQAYEDYIDPMEPRVRLQRRSEILHDVSYVVRYRGTAPSADDLSKHMAILVRRLRDKQSYRPPYFGRVQYPISEVEIVDDLGDVWPLSQKHDQDFGTLLLAQIYAPNGVALDAVFFQAQMRRGCIKVPTIDEAIAARNLGRVA